MASICSVGHPYDICKGLPSANVYIPIGICRVLEVSDTPVTSLKDVYNIVLTLACVGGGGFERTPPLSVFRE